MPVVFAQSVKNDSRITDPLHPSEIGCRLALGSSVVDDESLPVTVSLRNESVNCLFQILPRAFLVAEEWDDESRVAIVFGLWNDRVDRHSAKVSVV